MKFKLSAPKNYYFLIPICGGVIWGGMLIAMLACWSLQGHPIYYFIKSYMFPVYISYIGATNLQPLFISCAFAQGICYCLTILTEYLLRRSGKLQFWFKKDERNLMFAGTIFGIIGQIGIGLCAVFNTKDHSRAHSSLLALFVICVFLSMVCLMTQYALMGFHYQKIHVDHKYFNKFTISFLLKLFWTVCAVIFACLFEGLSNSSLSSCFEWTLAFWYLVLFAIMAWDLSSAAKTNHKNYPYIKNWNDHGYYLYDEHFGDDSNELPKHETLSTEDDENYRSVNRDFTDSELRQYPIGNRETYPIPEGQRVAVIPAVE